MAGVQTVANFCLVLLVGLPGSGKTTLVNFMKHYFSSEKDASKDYPCFNIIHICYDDLISSSLFQEFCANPNSGIWHNARREAFSMVDKLICLLKELPFDNNTQRLFLKYAEDNKYIRKNYEWKIYSTKKTLIVIDDNMYYNSMRYSYFQLARSHCIGFCQLYIECSVASALQYNKQRPTEDRVPENVIIEMQEKMEVPEGKTWEENSCSFNAHEPLSSDKTLQKIGRLISRALLNPIKCAENLSQVREKSREACMANTLHQCDLGLRHLVNERMKLLKQQSHNSDELKTQSRSLKIAREELLKAIKSRQVVIPEELCEAIETCNPLAVGLLQTFLSTLL